LLPPHIPKADMDQLAIQPFTKPIHGTLPIPGSKSITNRALILAALSNQEIELQGCLLSEDTRIMCRALQALGIQLQVEEATHKITIRGCGINWPINEAEIHVGNAGTAARFLTAMLCLKSGGTYHLDGTAAMRKRPMGGVLETLRKLGTEIECHETPDHFPFTIQTKGLPGGIWQTDASQSSQILSALMMAAPHADTDVTVELLGSTVSKPFVAMTLEMMRQTGTNISGDGLHSTGIQHSGPNTPPNPWQIEPDATAASYFLTLPALTGGTLTLPNLASKMLQGDIGYVKILQQIGLDAEFSEIGVVTNHADSYVQLSGGTFDFNPISDTFLTLAAISPLLSSPTTITGIAHTRKQETDRVHAMATELKRLGQQVEETEDSLHITPDKAALLEAAANQPVIHTYEDHRVAMSFGILGSYDLLENGQSWLTIEDPNCCAKTYPHFFQDLQNLHDLAHQA
jgi:3-phosphoshikimate 1-carboxyvinyltransferase